MQLLTAELRASLPPLYSLRWPTLPFGAASAPGQRLGEPQVPGIVDLKTMTVTKRLPTAAKPNGSTYAEPFRKVYVSDTLGKAVAVVNVDKDEIVKTLQFDSETVTRKR